ncbi:MAG: T9SS C-terminal target domain-containing protein, partial [Bacteroidetes bacterium]
GGAGGVILIDVNTVSSRPFTLEAHGGAGGGASYAGNDCNGPGGGGGGGVIWTRNPLGTIATTDVSGGMFGLTAATSGCPGGGGITRNGSSSGHDGVVLNGLNIPEETVNLNTCVLEAAAAELEASVRNGYVELYWQSMGELFNDTFVIERSKDGKLFERLETLAAEGGQAHEWADLNPLAGRSYYRIKLQDRQGAFIYSNQVEVQVQRPNFFSMKVFPNPANNNEILSLQTELPEGRKLQIVMTDMLGKRVLQQYLEVEAGKQTHSLELPALGPGTYILQAQAGKYISQAKIVII